MSGVFVEAAHRLYRPLSSWRYCIYMTCSTNANNTIHHRVVYRLQVLREIASLILYAYNLLEKDLDQRKRCGRSKPVSTSSKQMNECVSSRYLLDSASRVCSSSPSSALIFSSPSSWSRSGWGVIVTSAGVGAGVGVPDADMSLRNSDTSRRSRSFSSRSRVVRLLPQPLDSRDLLEPAASSSPGAERERMRILSLSIHQHKTKLTIIHYHAI